MGGAHGPRLSFSCGGSSSDGYFFQLDQQAFHLLAISFMLAATAWQLLFYSICSAFALLATETDLVPRLAVTLLFRAKTEFVAIPHALNSVSVFLDSAVEMEFWKACKLNSIPLLERIWDACLPETEPSPADMGSGNGVPSGHGGSCEPKEEGRPEYGRVALGPIPRLYRVCGRGASCSSYGRLRILQFFELNQIPPRRDGGAAMRDEINTDEGHVIRWGRRDMVQAAANKQHEVIWWLYKNTQAPRAMKNSESEENELGGEHVVRNADDESMRGDEIVDTPRPGRFQWVGALSRGNVGELLRGDPEEFMRTAGFGGCLGVMEWMVQNGYVNNNTYLAAHAAVEVNRLDMVEFLIDHELCEAGRALAVAARSCRLQMAKKTFGRGDGAPLWISLKTMVSAISQGNVECVKWLYETFRSEINLFNVSQLDSWEKKTFSIDTMAQRGNLALIRFLHKVLAVEKPSNSRKKKKAKTTHNAPLACTTAAMDRAASNEDFDRVLFLHSQRTEGCTWAAFDETRKRAPYTNMRETSFDFPSDNINDWLVEHYPDQASDDDDYY